MKNHNKKITLRSFINFVALDEFGEKKRIYSRAIPGNKKLMEYFYKILSLRRNIKHLHFSSYVSRDTDITSSDILIQPRHLEVYVKESFRVDSFTKFDKPLPEEDNELWQWVLKSGTPQLRSMMDDPETLEIVLENIKEKRPFYTIKRI